MVDSSMGERIAGLRRERGLSQAGLAAATGVSRSPVAQWETDRAGQVSGNLSRIHRAAFAWGSSARRTGIDR